MVDQDLLAKVRDLPCLACGRSPSDPDHVTSRGAGGGDVADNLLSLCREHHALRHSIGWAGMFNRFPSVMKWMIEHSRQDIIDRATRFEVWTKRPRE